MVVHYLDLLSPTVIPNETDPILVADPDAVLAVPIAGQGLEVIARKRTQISESLSRMELRELALRDPCDGLEPTGRKPLKEGFNVSVPKRPDHDPAYNGVRYTSTVIDAP